MSLGLWNVRGLNNSTRKNEVKNFLKKNKINLLALMETKVRSINFEHINKIMGRDFKTITNACIVDGPDRIWVCWNTNLWDVTILKLHDQYIHTKAKNTGGLEIYFTAVYGRPKPEEREILWSDLGSLKPSIKGPWIVGGDFNEVLRVSERVGSQAGPRWSRMEDFWAFLNQAELMELPHINGSTSWSNKRVGNDRVLSKIDRILINREWLMLWPQVKVCYHPCGTSDHDPMTINLLKITKAKKPFRFTNSWLKKEGLRTLVMKAWEFEVRGNAMYKFTKKLNNVKRILKRWSRSINPIKELEVERAKLHEIQTQLKNQPHLTQLHREELRVLSKIQELSNIEEENIRQISRTQWLRHGDGNTKFFAAMVADRKSSNCLFNMVDKNGKVMTTRPAVTKNCIEHFTKLYTEDSGVLNLSDYPFPRTVTEVQNRDLIKVPDFEEVRRVVMHLNPDKSPGPDGFNGAFFREFWEIIGVDLVKAVQSIFLGDNLLLEVNATFVTLIPKTKGARQLTEFRPISCVNTTYKIISKLLTNRLVIVLNDLIAENHTAFLPGRLIGDNYLLATEMIQGFNRTAGTAKACIKADLAKAFDTCSWQALETTLTNFKFSPEYIRIIMMLVTTVSYSYLIEGSPTPQIKPGRGLRQGDPLSPYLFTLLMQNFSSVINQKVESGDLGLYKVNGTKAVSHLAYADDLMVFCKATESSFTTLRDIFYIFRGNTGLRVSTGKSEVFFSSPTNDKQRLLDILGFNQGTFPVRYLGLPLSPTVLKPRDCSRLIEVVETMIAAWKIKLLSIPGRIQLFQWGIMGNFNFWNLSARLPATILNQLDHIAYNYMWNGQTIISKEQMTLPKDEGGLGVRDFRESQLAAIIKRTWRIWTSNDSIWARWMRVRYIKGRDLNSIPKRDGRDSALWAEVLDHKGKISSVISIGTDYNCVWTGYGSTFSYHNAWASIRHHEEPDPLSKGIWSLGVPKFSIALWRARWGKFTTDSQLAIWGITEDTDCYLCEDAMETSDHIFSHCSYIREIWRQIRGQQPQLFPSNPSTLDGYMEEARSKRASTACWGLAWMLIGAVVWAVWCERCKRKHESRSLPPAELGRRVLGDVHISFRPSRYKAAMTNRDADLVARWIGRGDFDPG